MARPRRFPSGTKTIMLRLPPEVIEAFDAKGGREWLMQELGFDFGPKGRSNTRKAKDASQGLKSAWTELQKRWEVI